MPLSLELSTAAAQLQAQIEADRPADGFDICNLANRLEDWSAQAEVLERLAKPATMQQPPPGTSNVVPMFARGNRT
jgi:hypothetical protein